MASVSFSLEELQNTAHFLSLSLNGALLENRYVTYDHRVCIRDLAYKIERIVAAVLFPLPSSSLISIRNRTVFLERQLQECVKRNILTSVKGPGKTVLAVERAIQALWGLAPKVGSLVPTESLDRPTVDIEDLRASLDEYYWVGFLNRHRSFSPACSGSYFEMESDPGNFLRQFIDFINRPFQREVQQ